MKMVREGTSRNGTPYVIRYPVSEDVRSVWAYINKLSKERTFIRFQGEEISLENEQSFVAERIHESRVRKSVTLFLIVAGHVRGIADIQMRDKTENHVGIISLSLDESVRGQGLGETLLQTVLDEARKKLDGLSVVALEVKAPNAAAIALYEKVGFKEYGRLSKGTRHRDEFVDMIFMYTNI